MANFSEQWSALEVKTKIAYITALVAFTIGWGLAIAGFVIGAGVVSDSVLWILGQALVYAASVFGVGLYVSGSVKNMKRAIRMFMASEDQKYRRGEMDGIIEEDEIDDDSEEFVG